MSSSGTGMSSGRRWVAVGVAGLGAAAVVTAVVAALVVGDNPRAPTAGTGTASATPPPPVATAPGGPGDSGAVAPSVSVPPRPAGPARQGDATHPGDGTWGVGPTAVNTVVASGTYETTVPVNSPGCTYIRIALNHTVIATHRANAGQHVTVTIAATDGLFNTKGCGEWRRVS